MKKILHNAEMIYILKNITHYSIDFSFSALNTLTAALTHDV